MSACSSSLQDCKPRVLWQRKNGCGKLANLQYCMLLKLTWLLFSSPYLCHFYTTSSSEHAHCCICKFIKCRCIRIAATLQTNKPAPWKKLENEQKNSSLINFCSRFLGEFLYLKKVTKSNFQKFRNEFFQKFISKLVNLAFCNSVSLPISKIPQRWHN